jgi:hypothetical protein
MLLGILVASVTYDAGLAPPGGAWQKDDIAARPQCRRPSDARQQEDPVLGHLLQQLHLLRGVHRGHLPPADRTAAEGEVVARVDEHDRRARPTRPRGRLRCGIQPGVEDLRQNLRARHGRASLFCDPCRGVKLRQQKKEPAACQ